MAPTRQQHQLPGPVPPGEWADQVMLAVPKVTLDLAEPQDRVRLRNWLEAALDGYLDALHNDLQRAAARGVASAVVQLRDPDYYEQRRARVRRPRVAEGELTVGPSYDELVETGKIVALPL